MMTDMLIMTTPANPNRIKLIDQVVMPTPCFFVSNEPNESASTLTMAHKYPRLYCFRSIILESMFVASVDNCCFELQLECSSVLPMFSSLSSTAVSGCTISSPSLLKPILCLASTVCAIFVSLLPFSCIGVVRCSSQATTPTPMTVRTIPPQAGAFNISSNPSRPKIAAAKGLRESITITCLAPRRRRASNHKTSPTMIPRVELSTKYPTLVTVNTSSPADIANPRTRHMMMNPIDATLHLYMFSANADAPEEVHRQSHIKKSERHEERRQESREDLQLWAR
mmetsp:Transcript_23337/g.43006  ORF Transcript_23337/g.43006 Transcript_23337/m.43006 type:complete len:282 (-) Transcript_23337:347-1192(-)